MLSQRRAEPRGSVLRSERVHRAGDPARGGGRVPGGQDRAATSAAARREYGEILTLQGSLIIACDRARGVDGASVVSDCAVELRLASQGG